MVDVVFVSLGKDDDVIQVSKHQPLENIVDQGPEDGRDVGEPKRYDQMFIMSSRGIGHRLLSLNQMISIVETLEEFKGLGHERVAGSQESQDRFRVRLGPRGGILELVRLAGVRN